MAEKTAERIPDKAPDAMGDKKANKKADKNAEGDGAATRKKPPILVVIVAVALIALVGVFVVVKKVAAKSHAASAQKKHEQGPVITLDEFLVNLGDPGGEHFLKVTIGLELDKSKGKTAEMMKDEVSPIRDAILTSLCSRHREDVDTLVGREKLKTEIKQRINAMLGDDLVSTVYFTNFVTQ